jgi:Fe2+ transport system protein FeoA
MHLSDLKINDTGIIKKINSSGTEIRRLYDLGFVVGSQVSPILISPSKLIKAYLIKDSIIALRNSDASKIEVEYA